MDINHQVSFTMDFYFKKNNKKKRFCLLIDVDDRLFFPRQQQSGDGWLRNQVFRIKGEHYTLHDRRGGGTFGSVWSSTKPNGNFHFVD